MESLTLPQLLEVSFGLLGAIAGCVVLLLALRLAPTLTLYSHRRVLRILAIIALLVVISELIGVVAPFFRESTLIDILEEAVELVLISSGAIVLHLLGYAEAKEIAPLRRSAEADELTGLSSRAFFSRAAMRRIEFSQANNLPLTCIALDVDNFKEYNDGHGHGAGDEALRCVARAMRNSSRADDLVARHGGEEFVLLMGGDVKDAMEVAERIRRGVERGCPSGDDSTLPTQVTASLGIAPLTEDMCTLEELLKAADEAMYHAKKTGKNRVSVVGDP